MSSDKEGRMKMHTRPKDFPSPKLHVQRSTIHHDGKWYGRVEKYYVSVIGGYVTRQRVVSSMRMTRTRLGAWWSTRFGLPDTVKVHTEWKNTHA